MKPRARSVYFSKFILNSLSLFRSPNGAAETSSQGVWLRHQRPRAGTAARNVGSGCVYRKRPARNSGGERDETALTSVKGTSHDLEHEPS